MALILLPAMWTLYRPSKNFIEQTIKECEQATNASAMEDELLRAAKQTPMAPEGLLRAAHAETPDLGEELLRANIVQVAQDQPVNTRSRE